MQTLYFDVAECPTGTLGTAARHRLDGDEDSGRIYGVTLIAATGEAVMGEPAEGEAEGPVVGWNFRAGRVDANCDATLANANALFAKAADDLGDGSSADVETVYALVKPLIKPRTFRKIMIEPALAEAGLLPAFDAYLASVTLKPGYTAARAWNTANDIREDFPNYDTFFAGVKSALGLTDAQAEAILANCVIDNSR